MIVAGVFGVSTLYAQEPTSNDKDFLKNTAQDSNYEIRTAKLVLQKGTSPDVKAYANMILQDHTALNRQIAKTDTATKIDPVKPGSMSLSDDASYAKLKLLTGKTFEDSYIKSLSSGNEDAVNAAKSEASGSAIPAIKQLAEHRAALDTKHAQKANALAKAHGISEK